MRRVGALAQASLAAVDAHAPLADDIFASTATAIAGCRENLLKTLSAHFYISPRLLIPAKVGDCWKMIVGGLRSLLAEKP
jgi:hypothetical protein